MSLVCISALGICCSQGEDFWLHSDVHFYIIVVSPGYAVFCCLCCFKSSLHYSVEQYT